MVLFTAEHIKKSYTEKPLLEDINISISDEDKIGLVGVNGSGKTTLLKIIAGVLEHEGGSIISSRELRKVYLPQNPHYDPQLSIEEQAKVYVKDMGLDLEFYRLQTMLTKLNIVDFNQKMCELSGGERKRVAMACVLAADSNLLILDEPTNHMDNDMILWLEDFLIKYKGAVFMITHDRYFLERVTNQIVEIHKGKLYSYQGNYDAYLEQKAAKLEMELASERKRQAIFKKELAWIRRGAQARTTKAKGRIQRFHELEENKLVVDDSSLELNTVSSRLGKKIIEIKNLTKGYEGKPLIKDFSYILLRGDRVGIVGPNGCGKSTLIKTIMGIYEPDNGSVEVGDTVKIGYFSQENQSLPENQRVIKFISEISNDIKTDEGSFSASQMLERFLFPPHMHSVEIGRLSGGEKRRLYLLSILMTAPNVLIFDEPTNDLDIETLTVLEDYLDSFKGAVMVVSHDRYFLDRITDKTFAFEKEGHIQMFNGGYSQWEVEYQAKKEEQKQKEKEAKRVKEESHKKTNEKVKFSYNEKREFEMIDDEIEALENEITRIDRLMSESASDFAKLTSLQEERDAIEEKLEYKLERWEYLNQLAEKMEGNC